MFVLPKRMLAFFIVFAAITNVQIAQSAANALSEKSEVSQDQQSQKLQSTSFPLKPLAVLAAIGAGCAYVWNYEAYSVTDRKDAWGYDVVATRFLQYRARELFNRICASKFEEVNKNNYHVYRKMLISNESYSLSGLFGTIKAVAAPSRD
jgi:hypothetical protein